MRAAGRFSKAARHSSVSTRAAGRCSKSSKKLLEGTGNLHRHVKLKSKSDLETAALRALLKAARARREKAGQTSRK